jgi:hypothetical protein
LYGDADYTGRAKRNQWMSNCHIEAIASGVLLRKTPRWKHAHPAGVLPRKGSLIAPKGVADLLLEGCWSSHGVWPHGGQTLGPERVSGGTPDTPEFFAEQKMRPYF